MRGPVVWVVVAALSGCAVYYGHRLDERFGPTDPARYDRPSAQVAGLDYWRDVKPVLDNRCVVCHGCYDAPCQLNLASYQGTTRGARGDDVYASRLIATEPTRMSLDAHSNAAWRGKGFHPVLNERAAIPEAEREASVLYRALRMKRSRPHAAGAELPAGIDFSLGRAQQCPAIEEMDAFERKFPDWGMPFGLPGLSDREYGTLTRWIEAGAPYRDADPLAGGHVQRVQAWERFLNGDDLKTRLMARYVYEHWFLAHLYFDDLPGRESFELVRSRTPPGRPIDVIATRRPYDDPGTDRVYYRLRRMTDTLLVKTHMPYALSAERMARLKRWFLDPPYEVKALPSYAAQAASNPFATFEQLPVNGRYRFMLEEAQFTIMGFIKGPVCRGQVALGVINDHFWVMFVSPDVVQADTDGAFLARERSNLDLPGEQEGVIGLVRWRRYSRLETDYLEAKARHLMERLGETNPPTLEMLWDGDRANPNAALTVFRHYDSASVIQGLHGDHPQTAWVIGYPLLERIHYLLVAGFDVYGNTGHQLVTRLYMDFLRMEGELSFLGFLPRAARQAVRDRWYRGASREHSQFLKDTNAYYAGETGIAFKSRDPLAEWYGLLKARVAPAGTKRHTLESGGLKGASLASLRELSGLRGRAISHFPETAFLTVRDAAGGSFHYSVIRNSAHANVAELFGEERRRLPDEDTLSVLSGFVGSYPNAFFLVDAADLPAFVTAVRGLASEADYRKVLARYGIRRMDPRFWAHSDALLDAYRRDVPREAALFDYNRFENR
jgi:hypothetical protein